jgi:hypothetical protein
METETQGAGARVRGWLLAALGVAFVALVAYQMWPEQSATPAVPASNRQVANRRTGPARTGAARGEIDPAELKVRLDALQAKAPDFGEGERNPFRFQPPPAPPQPKPVAPTGPIGPPPPPLPPPPPPIPPVPLKFMGTVEKPGLTLAALTDCKGFSYAAREGEIIDGRYRLVKIQVESVILEYSNGTGRTTVRKSGDCPK